MTKRLYLIIFITAFTACILMASLCSSATKSGYYRQAAESQSMYTLSAGILNAQIYDTSLNSLTYLESRKYAAINPTAAAVEIVVKYVKDKDYFYKKVTEGKPFVCEVENCFYFDSSEITVFDVPVRENGIAQHILGYVLNGEGISGLEYDYNKFLRSFESRNTVSYFMDGMGNFVYDTEKKVSYAETITAGVVTTIDRDIQQICEEAFTENRKGAVIVTDVKSGDILACVSRPTYDAENPSEYLEDEDSPFINRALCSYNTGSIFKLVISAAAIEENLEGFMYDCTGSAMVGTQSFSCHKTDGHSLLGMENALINSCNTYFIELTRLLSSEKLIEITKRCGFGRQIRLSDSIISESGYVPDIQELSIPAEKANFSFGQGMLLTTPLQIAQFTGAVANGGTMCEIRLVKGITYDGINIVDETESYSMRVLDEYTAETLKKFMTSSCAENAKSDIVSIASKTSTAQTGKFDDNGEEICNAAITGFFPSENPEYTVTVLCEGGGYGNVSAAPVLKTISENIWLLKKLS